MLLNLHIKNLALIDEIDVGFDDKLNILTGETGAGKSIIIGSLGICLGGKFPRDLLRDDTKDGICELLFSVDNDNIREQLLLLDVDLNEDNEILISRRLNSSGRTINRINDSTVTTAKLREVSSILINLHAQHEQQTLLKADKHMEILDRFGGKEIQEKKLQVSQLYKEYMAVKAEIADNSMDEHEKNKQMDFLTYQINEIKSASLKPGEDEELEKLYKKAVNSKEILATADEIYRLTGYNSTNSASDSIGHALQKMGRLVELSEDLSDTYNILQDIDSMLNDFNRELNQYMKGMEFDDKAFFDIESRLDLINTLKSKYGRCIQDVISCLEKYEQELAKLAEYEEYMQQLENKLADITKKLTVTSDELTEIRKKEAFRLCSLIKESLEDLNFMSVEFDMNFSKLDKFTAEGNDEAVFMISTNIGQPMRPLYEVASGGELSRVMLAIKSGLADEDDTPTLVFDEIDVGISGRTAQKVAEKMSILGKNHQLICITHLPQIAAMADSHYSIEKNVENNKTVTNIRKLSKQDQISEIARLLGGATITEATLFAAEEMKGLADRTKLY